MRIPQTANLRIHLLMILFFLAGYAGGAVAAVPTVDGNTIVLPDDGEYEVQLILTGETVCLGDQVCTVSDGNYRVTGISGDDSSSTDVVVGNPVEIIIDQSNFAYALKVSGRTINWIVDGWYQVQDAQTFNEICNGTDSCTVPAVGRYVVINHSLGLRFVIEVNDSSGPVALGNTTITWPADGWYQVKRISGEFICAGVDACSPGPGTYLVSRFYLGGGTTWRVVLGDQEEQIVTTEPTVVGNTISFPEDSTYEVQFTLSGEIVCDGSQSCSVVDGNYRVTVFTDGGTSSQDIVVGNPEEIIIEQSDFEYALNVADRTIIWSAGGWYQVQDAQTYEEICNGPEFCTVPAVGRYIVINHSLGLRTVLEVSDTSGPVVSNNTISWPDNGWYQVKNEATGNLICEGVDACSMPDGTYLVSRFYYGGGTTWRVVLGSPVEQNSEPSVVNNTISWADNGWYQVENRITREIVCQGGRACTVPEGIYWVTRYYDRGTSSWRIIVGNPEELTLDQAGFADTLTVSGRTINWSLGGWYQVQDAQTFEEICNGGELCTVPRDGSYYVINHSLGLRLLLQISEGV